ncbi:MAG: 7-cyano-7-deazaguanine synthase QueC [Phycisphaerales bacterium]|nr:7-cyano-7-deazaguanine synthase QueC [Planctomycetota bacterium]MCH8509508.1 7-cyano-7-deazaguanine synthase QueC [Phycisphaerales bacterium]
MSPSDGLNPDHHRPGVVLLSGGLDSATVLAIAQKQGFACHALAFDYGQRHRHELDAARRVAEALGAASFRVFPIDTGSFGGSALTDPGVAVPKDRSGGRAVNDIPITYVPARNLVFLSVALALAETLGAHDLFIGVNEVDYSGYPDCRPEFIASFQQTANLATKAGVERNGFTVHTPLIGMGKDDIIRAGTALGVDYAMTHSCYDPVVAGGEALACGRCDSCRLRRRGFERAGVADPTKYAGTA